MGNHFLQSFLGGALIGLSVVILLVGNGRIAGISGILHGLLEPKKGSVAWHAYFVLGLAVAGYLSGILSPQSFDLSLSVNMENALSSRTSLQIAFAGILVGFGTVMGNGCTSGHGICGNARFSPRSLVATLVFIFVGVLTATWIIPLLGG